jgi:hemerythrin-like domain-containing protein
LGVTENLREQHREILHIAQQISTLLNGGEQLKDGAEINSLLSELSGCLNYHLVMEDEALYPALFRHPDKKVVAVAKRYFDDIGGLRKEFKSYLSRWPDAEAIEGNMDGFINETRGIFEALSRRIDKEDDSLYPLLDRD